MLALSAITSLAHAQNHFGAEAGSFYADHFSPHSMTHSQAYPHYKEHQEVWHPPMTHMHHSDG